MKRFSLRKFFGFMLLGLVITSGAGVFVSAGEVYAEDSANITDFTNDLAEDVQNDRETQAGGEAKDLNKLENAVWYVVSAILELVIKVFGGIAEMMIGILLTLAKFNAFVNHPVVGYGWVVVRDICNMFYVFIMLVIAFSTILHVESYSYRQLLRGLVISAVLINFSKTIAGLLIDFGQVIMLTFVNAFAATGASNFAIALGFGDLTTIRTEVLQAVNSSGANQLLALVAGAFLAAIVVATSAIVLLVMVMFLLWRIVMLWIMIILSPMAYLFSVMPQTQRYASQWWSRFTELVVNGPILAFFLWLALVVAGDPTQLQFSGIPATGLANGIGDANVLARYLISISLMIAGLKVAQEIGGLGGKMAGKGYGWLAAAGGLGYMLGKRGAKKMVTFPVRSAAYGAAGKAEGLGFWRSAFTQKGRDRVAAGVKAKATSFLPWEKDAYGKWQNLDASKQIEERLENKSVFEVRDYMDSAYRYGNKTNVQGAMRQLAKRGEINHDELTKFNQTFGSYDTATVAGQNTASFNVMLESMAVKEAGAAKKGISEFEETKTGYKTLSTEDRLDAVVKAVANADEPAKVSRIIKELDITKDPNTGKANMAFSGAVAAALLKQKDRLGLLSQGQRDALSGKLAVILNNPDAYGADKNQQEDIRKLLHYSKADYDGNKLKNSATVMSDPVLIGKVNKEIADKSTKANTVLAAERAGMTITGHLKGSQVDQSQYETIQKRMEETGISGIDGPSAVNDEYNAIGGVEANKLDEAYSLPDADGKRQVLETFKTHLIDNQVDNIKLFHQDANHNYDQRDQWVEPNSILDQTLKHIDSLLAKSTDTSLDADAMDGVIKDLQNSLIVARGQLEKGLEYADRIHFSGRRDFGERLKGILKDALGSLIPDKNFTTLTPQAKSNINGRLTSAIQSLSSLPYDYDQRLIRKQNVSLQLNDIVRDIRNMEGLDEGLRDKINTLWQTARTQFGKDYTDDAAGKAAEDQAMKELLKLLSQVKSRFG